jgi:ribosomal protein S27AE
MPIEDDNTNIIERQNQHCPQCGRLTQQTVHYDPDIGKWHECGHCGHEWSYADENCETS